ncbi:MAG: hypothetical protein NVSMB33_09320 [Ktedonobacteraceae bacterium]
MREVHNIADFAEQLAAARREALAAFGDDTIFLERLISQPRHVEVQVLGDRFGNLIHLGERECSIQRRHQKIVEESPSIALTPALRTEMGETAVRIAKAAGYINAGTLEFMLDADKHFYFLEMNTRLQVEHPVTELVTGIDLVRHQLLVAAGKPLHFSQEQISSHGHAIEMRLYAEDPVTNFLPSTGTVTRIILPEGPGIRIDSGIDSGDEITQFYDPLIAKIIVYGEDRVAAIARMQQALRRSAVFGVKTNASLLYSIATAPAFQEGRTHTGFLVEHGLIGESAFQEHGPIPNEVLIAAALYDSTAGKEISSIDSAYFSKANGGFFSPWNMLGPWRMIGEAQIISYKYQDEEHSVALDRRQEETRQGSVQVDKQAVEQINFQAGNDDLILLRYGAQQIRAYVQHIEDETQVVMHGQMYRLKRRQAPDVDTTAQGSNPASTQKALTAPMAGTIVKVQVREGETVEQRQVLVILSAMKMEHTIAAPYAGRVRRVHYQEGAVVRGGATVVEME